MTVEMYFGPGFNDLQLTLQLTELKVETVVTAGVASKVLSMKIEDFASNLKEDEYFPGGRGSIKLGGRKYQVTIHYFPVVGEKVFLTATH